MTNLMFEHDRIAAPDDAPKVHIIPFGLEDTVSYEGGTAKAPQATFRAAKEVELWDDELWKEPIRSFNEEIIETGPIAPTIEEGMGQLEGLVRKTLEAGAFPMTLGFASDAQYLHDTSWLRKRTSANPLDMGYYTPEVHEAAFALPAYIRKGLES